MLIENVPAEVCTECGMRYYAAKALKSIEETIRGRGGQSGKSLFQRTRRDGARHVVVAFGMRRAPARVKRWVPIEQVRVINA